MPQSKFSCVEIQWTLFFYPWSLKGSSLFENAAPQMYPFLVRNSHGCSDAKCCDFERFFSIKRNKTHVPVRIGYCERH